jgi:hypothetical protein
MKCICVLGSNGSGRSTWLRGHAPPGWRIADDLGDGLSPAACEREAVLLRFVPTAFTTQNPSLLDYLLFDNVEEAQATFRVWRGCLGEFEPMTDEEAERFWAAYESCIQQVHDILLDMGVWS